MDSGDMERKIISAAIACIETYGIADTTVRKIAAEAGVNIAAVNYYFGSKDELIARALDVSLDNAFDWDHFEASDNDPPRERLCCILEHFAIGSQNYPELTRLHFFGQTSVGNRNTRQFDRLAEFLERIYDDLTARGAQKSGTDLRFAILQAISAVVFCFGLQPGMSAAFCQIDLRDAEYRSRYIKSLVDGLL